MTIAITLKVNDGIVLAADSASTFSDNQGFINVYENANKVFNLHKELPLGAMTWGAGSIGNASIETLAKDFRKLISTDPNHMINPDTYTVEDVAKSFHQFIYHDHYVPSFAQWTQKPDLGFMIAGYSAGADSSELWQIDIGNGGVSHGPARKDSTNAWSILWSGQPEAITRIMKGYSQLLPDILAMAGLDQPTIDKIIMLCDFQMQASMVQPAMPIKDAIDLVYFLADLTAKYVKYTPGHNTVGGPIEIAAITKHEGFKWIQRKYYFSSDFNPR